jgi:glycosyltransferase involved in cell wall biosynthesis
MRILFSTDHAYIPERAGGVESSTHELCTALSDRGHDVAVSCCLDPHGVFRFRTYLGRRLAGQCGAHSERSQGYPVYRSWNVEDNARIVVAQFRPDVVVVQPDRQVYFARMFRQTGVATLIYLRDAEFQKLGGSPSASDGTTYVANSAFLADKVSRTYDIGTSVLPPLIDSRRYRVESGRTDVLFVNPDPLKGVETALALAQRRPDIPFVFVESWPSNRDQTGYRRRALSLGNVKWHPRTSDMRIHYSRAKVVLVPSVCDESWCRVVTEAHASGIPVIASARGGLPESVGPGGILVNPIEELDAWERALGALWDDAPCYARLVAAADEYSARPEMQPDRLVARFLQLLDSAPSSTG